MEKTNMEKEIPQVKKIVLSGIIMALYIVMMFFTQGFAFGQFQVRIATSLYSLSAIFPFLIVPLSIGNMLSNILMGGLGIYDIAGGFIVGLITTGLVYIIKKVKLNDWMMVFPLILGPGLIVPIWLTYITKIPYRLLAVSLCVGQIIPAVLGVLIVKGLKNKI